MSMSGTLPNMWAIESVAKRSNLHKIAMTASQKINSTVDEKLEVDATEDVVEFTIKNKVKEVEDGEQAEYWDDKLDKFLKIREPIHMPRIISVPKGTVVNPEKRKIGWIGTGSSGQNMAY